MMEEWKRDNLGYLLELAYGKSLPKYKRVDGNIPVYGSNGIVGFHNVAIVNEPGIIVGRKGSAGNVRISKVPFCPIDTTFYITQQHSKLDLEYLYYALNFLDLKRILGDVGVPGLNREMAYLEELFYPSDKAEQRKIAHVLSTVQKAIEQQDKLILTTTELKKALMQKLFTEGTRGEPQKETEIGLVPESWAVVELGKLLKLKYGKGLPKKNRIKGKFPVYGSNGIVGTHNEYFVKGPGIIVGRKGSAGLVHYCKENFNPIDTTFYITKETTGLDLKYLFFLLKMVDLTRISGDVGVPGLNREMAYLEKVAITRNINEQQKIAESIDTVDNKIEYQNKKKQTLTDLFKTLLHELMTGQRRVHELEFEKENAYTNRT
jgi:type I restriction enzyme S subunit